MTRIAVLGFLVLSACGVVSVVSLRVFYRCFSIWKGILEAEKDK